MPRCADLSAFPTAALTSCAVTLVASLAALPTAAQPDSSRWPSDSAPRTAIRQRIALLELEPLGMDPEPVSRLESLFRRELERLAATPLPSRRATEQALAESPELRRCSGEDRCLAAIGKKLGVDLVVAGNVAALGDSYVINIKVVDARKGIQLRRTNSPPLRGNPDELIEAVRMAAYDLLAEAELVGAVMVLSNLSGAEVSIDGQRLGQTPLRGPVSGLSLGEHQLVVEAPGYQPFSQTVHVRFQKTTRVLVEMAPHSDGPLSGVLRAQRPPSPSPWYTSPWFYVTAAAAALVGGAYLGYQLGNNPVIDCAREPERCR